MRLWRLLRADRAEEAVPSAEGVVGEPPEKTNRSESEAVAGERGVASLHRTRSTQTRVSNLLAVGLMSTLALGFLAWYYTQTFARHSRAQAEVETRSKQQAQGEMALPPLGRVEPPVVERVLGPAPDPVPDLSLSADRFYASQPRPYVTPSYGNSAPVKPEDRAVDRRLSGPVFVSASRDAASERSSPDLGEESEHRGSPELARGSDTTTTTSALSGLLQPTVTSAMRAKVLATERLLLPKGAFLDCTLETAIDSSLPGMTTCVTATDTFGVDGSVVLMERGTKLVGETRGDVRHGSARVYVLWTEARTPDGIVVPLASPGTDELGRAGLPGDVNRHFWERFGAAILVSVIDGAVQAAVQRASDGGDGTVVVNPSTSRDIMTEVLRSTINIPPTVTKQNGDRIAVLVARDLDFRSVYELRPVALQR